MAGPVDVRDALSAGNVVRSGARSPQPYAQLLPTRPRLGTRANASLLPRSFTPPPPIVEDEAESLARELDGPVAAAQGDDDGPRCRGDVEQLPIILPMPDPNANAERRFVLLSKPDDSDSDSDADDGEPAGHPYGRASPATKHEYEANTCRKFTTAQPEAPTPSRPGEMRRRKSHVELPRIETGAAPAAQSGLHRVKSSASVKRMSYDDDAHRRESRATADGFLSPTTPSVIKHSTKGRDRVFVDFNPGNNTEASRSRYGEPHIVNNERRSATRPERRDPSVGRPAHRRAQSAIELEKASRRKSSDFQSPPLAKKSSASPPLGNRRSPVLERRASSPPRERENLSGRRSSYKPNNDSNSPPRNDGEHSGDEQYKASQRRRRKSTVTQSDRPASLLSPDSAARPSIPKPRTKTPAASPRFSHGQFADEDQLFLKPHSSNALGDRAGHHEREPSPFSSGASSPYPPPPPSQTRLGDAERPLSPRPRSRPPSFVDVGAGAAALALMPVFPTSPSPSPPIGQRRSPTAPPSASRRGSVESGRSAQPSRPFLGEPGLGRPIDTYSQYLEAARAGIIPDIPQCSRLTPKPGYNDWFTFARRDEFNVCPDCYMAICENQAFRNEMVVAPFRPRDKKIACDLGASPWYRLALFLTQKYQLEDLSLLKAVADGIEKHRPCAGDRKANRTWHSIRDPYNHKTIPNFEVCAGCVSAVEALFPKLANVFEPVDAPGESPKGVCALHFSPLRRRFHDYVGILESVSNQALASNSSPDVELLVAKLHRKASVGECPRDMAVDDKDWHVMRKLPWVSVCEECFGEVVFPKSRPAPSRTTSRAGRIGSPGPPATSTPSACGAYFRRRARGTTPNTWRPSCRRGGRLRQISTLGWRSLSA